MSPHRTRTRNVFPAEDIRTGLSVAAIRQSMGKFSSDRAIREYCEEIWHVKPVRIKEKPGCPESRASRGYV